MIQGSGNRSMNWYLVLAILQRRSITMLLKNPVEVSNISKPVFKCYIPVSRCQVRSRVS